MITIDRITRQMRIPDNEKILGVESDDDSHTLYFTCASSLDPNFDLDNANIYINFKRPDGQIGQYMVLDKMVVDGYCTFSWIVDRAAYAVKGTVNFIVCMKNVDEDGIVQKEWNTTLGKLIVLEGIEPEGETPIPEEDLDLISQLVNYVKSTVDQAEADINSTKTSAIEALDQKETELSDAIDDKIADLNTLGVIRPNLLINSDFKSGIINQRMKTDYSNGCTVDRWMSGGVGVRVSTDRLVLVNNTDASHSFQQRFEEPITGTFTLYADLGNANLAEGAYFWSYIAEDGKYTRWTNENLKEGANTVTFTGTIYSIGISLPAGKQVQLKQIKLEKGSIFTGMPQWDFATELLKCKRYYKQYYRYPIRPVSSGTRTYLLPITFDVEMAKIPSIICNEILNSSEAPTGAHLSEFVASVYNITNIVFDKNIGDYGFLTLALDAEMY